ncbi:MULTISPECIES: prenyltransferase/squalene oxidase repeat-containing protein [Streptomycetaceae]|uniref:Drimenyl diphosphate synthase n=1 Tax=Streptantibioticus cattleyicolor (strain ATCC 35852 / DSM 46488 / JCM 4925 / NBRC 14057 / NRRL 8057) TaxID=1003195 RepID=DMS_STREN|nr:MULTISPECIES: prenyltransferase/squalene oxidase repeat-containing protein [Streptomycetaceae]AEW97977.1 hypothetical protein SCATT_56060 [Streptantibioticus cattleyicolor NRRL 8057 = DSM 46488]MYS62378.1 prenyltransferase [Streptomyces sp. SID5468]CCB78295.1 conserved protein of unknown function [Streptantibioticus cattleyicolor NRRL 8057 = DSM 46488]
MITSSLLSRPGRTAPAGSAALRCRDRLAQRVADQVGPDGLVKAPCASRVLESSLLLRLLTVEGYAPHVRERLTRYLRNRLEHRPPDAIQGAVARAALGERLPGGCFAERALASFDHFTADRKRLMFTTLLAELGVTVFPRTRPEAFTARGQQSWLQAEMAALKIMTAYGTGTTGLLTERDWFLLAPAVRPGPVWEGNHFARLLALLALRKNPAHRGAVRRTLEAVTADLRPDGGLPFITGMDIFATAIAGLALTGPAACAHAGHRPVRCGTGPLPAAMADALATRQNPDGGFAFTPGVRQSDVDDTSYTVEFLRVAGPYRHRSAIAAAERYLLAVRNPDGGFPTFARGTPSEIAMTAAAVNALAPNPAHRTVVDEALAFLTRRRQPDGILERSWSRNVTNAVFRTTLACAAAGPGAPPGLSRAAGTTKRQATRYLASVQNLDGGWGHHPGDASDPISTAYAVIALSRDGGHPTALARALDHLVRAQRPDGGYRSRPDQAGPRPLLYDVPALADVCVLLGLAHAVGPTARPRV